MEASFTVMHNINEKNPEKLFFSPSREPKSHGAEKFLGFLIVTDCQISQLLMKWMHQPEAV